MIYLIIFAAIASVIGLVITIMAGLNADDTNYSSQKSFKNMSIIYILILPLILIIGFFVYMIIS
ncbi:hypothetical protein [Alkalihalobacillus pseudalcaliphilus]|uniref:hypothetical protein n=1 Tax=Alkalihalobacillus pseudalcaliphilus TaxID=79884 RepID=UPI00064E08E3|nr:hypothetical protein [Alkalihalobacillus pseudalcaliphilus]KMK75766.1 hypothetical protein AB990_10885 [Alkalihalobacillus pseudalcaliphilus]